LIASRSLKKEANRIGLPVTAAVAATATVEPAAVKSAAVAESTAPTELRGCATAESSAGLNPTAESAADEPVSASNYVATETAPVTIPAPAIKPASTVVATCAVKWTSAVAPPAPAIPRTCADKDPADEIIWPVIAIGRTCVRGVIVVPVGASGRRSDIYRPAPNPNSYPNLGVGIGRDESENS